MIARLHSLRITSWTGRTPCAGINFILSSMVFNVVPTFLEVTMVAGILAYRCGPAFAALTAGTIAAYTAFTFAVTAVREPASSASYQAPTAKQDDSAG